MALEREKVSDPVELEARLTVEAVLAAAEQEEAVEFEPAALPVLLELEANLRRQLHTGRAELGLDRLRREDQNLIVEGYRQGQSDP